MLNNRSSSRLGEKEKVRWLDLQSSPAERPGVLDQEVQDSSVLQERGIWAGKLDFFLSCLGFSVGLGNIWRFPYICYKNGGGAFLLPYLLFLVVGGIPLVFLEMSFGQFAGQGPLGVWRVAPLFKGVGIGMVVISGTVSVFYNMVMAWSIFYLFASMQTPLPWTSCDNDWNTPACCEKRIYEQNCSITGESDVNVTCMRCLSSLRNNISSSSAALWNGSVTLAVNVTNVTKFMSPAEEYFRERVLAVTSSISHLGIVWWPMALCLLAAWILVLLCLIRGIKSSGKVVYFTALFPYVMLLVLLVRTAMLEGAREGIIFYLQPKWHTLGKAQVWHDAANQAFFSLGACYGGLITLSSYNRFDNNCYRTALAVPILDTLSSVFAGFVVFATLGHIAWQLNTSVDGVVMSGPGLAFVAYPQAIASMSGAHVWAFLFFLMLVSVGLDSQLVFVATVTDAICDEFPRQLRKRRVWVLVVCCLVMFLLGLPMASQGGLHIFNIMDRYSTDWPILVFSILECVILGWVYGVSKFQQDIWTMVGQRPGCWWRAMWQFISPATSLFVLVFAIVQKSTEEMETETEVASRVAVCVLTGLGVAPILIYAVYAILTTRGSIGERLRILLTPSANWGPPWSLADLKPHLLALPEYMLNPEDESISSQALARRLSIFVPALRRDSADSGTSTMDLAPRLNCTTGVVSGEDIDTGSIEWSTDENQDRGNWAGKYDFLVSGLGYCIGIGNVWRFPYLVYRNGGGAFFIPYLLMLLLCGIPLFYLELAVGQFASVGAITVWRSCPIFKGLGYSMVLTTFLYSIYYNVLNSWTLYYVFASLTKDLPWLGCNNTWNTEACLERSLFANRTKAICTEAETLPDFNNETLFDFNISSGFGGWKNTSVLDATTAASMDALTTASCNVTVPQFTTPSEEYFFNQVLGLSSGIDVLGAPRWHLSLCLLLCWVITFAALIRGVKSAGKIVYITVALPYLIMLVLMVRYATLDPKAHLDGIKYYVQPDWSRLKDAQVWGDAASQLFFSLGLSAGGLVTLSSYNRFHYNSYRDVYMICVVDTLTSAFAGFVVFAILGVMAKEAGTDVENVVTSKFTLAFVAYPEAVSQLPAAPLWSLLFFLMLCSMAVDTQFLMVQTIVVALTDEFNKYLGKRRLWVITALCVGMYLLGLPLVTEGGLYIVILMDYYVTAWAPLIGGIVTCVALAWVYKVDNLCYNIKVMMGHKVSYWWRIMWKFVTPALLISVLIFSWAKYTPPRSKDYEYPDWAHAIGWILSLASVSIIPVYAVVDVLRGTCRGELGCKQVISQKTCPDIEWGPALAKHRDSCALPQVLSTETLDRTMRWVIEGQANRMFHTDSSASMTSDLHTTSWSSSTQSKLANGRMRRSHMMTSTPKRSHPKKRPSRVSFTMAGKDLIEPGYKDKDIIYVKTPAVISSSTDQSTQTEDSFMLQDSPRSQPSPLRKLCLLRIRQFVDMDSLRARKKASQPRAVHFEKAKTSQRPSGIRKKFPSPGRKKSPVSISGKSTEISAGGGVEFSAAARGSTECSAERSCHGNCVYTVAQIEPAPALTVVTSVSDAPNAHKYSIAQAQPESQKSVENSHGGLGPAANPCAPAESSSTTESSSGKSKLKPGHQQGRPQNCLQIQHSSAHEQSPPSSQGSDAKTEEGQSCDTTPSASTDEDLRDSVDHKHVESVSLSQIPSGEDVLSAGQGSEDSGYASRIEQFTQL